jgi:anti-anti-sigma factor
VATRDRFETVAIGSSVVSVIASAGLGALVSLCQWVSASGGVLRLVIDDETMAGELLRITRIGRLMQVYSDPDTALSAA